MPPRVAAGSPEPAGRRRPRRLRGALSAAALWIGLAVPLAAGDEPAWPQWRGPRGDGVARGADPPLRWSESDNLRWKVPIPGRGLSTPLVVGDRVVLTSAVPHGETLAEPPAEAPGAHDNLAPLRRLQFRVLALDRRTGRLLWQRTVRDARPHEGAHLTAGWASASPVTDGERIFAFFGSQGLFAFDLEGELLWQRDLGDMTIFHGHGEGSSPALHGGTLVINWDHQGDSFLVALDAATGAERWRVERDEITSWSTPLIVPHRGRMQVIVAATGRTRAYDLADGRLLWQAGGLSRNVVASPVAGGGLAFVGSSYERRALLAIRLDAALGAGDGSPVVAWSRDRDTPYVPSPILYDGVLCFLKHLQSVLTCVEAATGRTLHGPRRLPGSRGVFASPVGAAGRIYVTSRDGTTAVVGLGGGYPLLAVNRLDDAVSASAAIAGDALLLRGERHLYCLGRPSGGSPPAPRPQDPPP